MVAAVLVAASSVACSDDNEETKSWSGKKPTVEAGEATSTTLSFTVTPNDADKTAWVCVKKSEAIPSASEILSSGTVVDKAAGATVQVAAELAPSTEYVIQVAAQCGDEALLIDPLTMTTAEETVDGGIELTNLVEAVYTADNTNSVGQYTLTLSSCATNSYAYPDEVGGLSVSITFYNALDSDPLNATLPSGTYEAGNDKSAFTWDPNYSIAYIRTAEGDDGMSYTIPAAGSVIVQRDADTYTVSLDITALTGEEIKATYKGAIVFTQAMSNDYESFTSDQNVTLTEGQGRYYGNWDYPHADDWMLQFFNGTFEDNNIVDGYYICLADIFTHKLDNYNTATPVIEDGTYSVTKVLTTEVSYNIPQTVTYGYSMEYMGEEYNQGSYLIQIDRSTGRKYIAYFDSGTITVKRTGDVYNFDFDVKTADGISIKATFSNKMTIVNYNDRDKTQPTRLGGTLTKDVELNLGSNAEALAFNMGSILYPNYNSWLLCIGTPNGDSWKGDYITTEFLAPSSYGNTLQPGTYTVFKSSDSKKDPGSYDLLPGWITRSGNCLYTWYADMSSTDDGGYQGVLGRVTEGTMTVTQSGDNYTFVFNFIDDEGHKITGEWTGKVEQSNLSTAKQHKARKALPKLPKVKRSRLR